MWYEKYYWFYMINVERYLNQLTWHRRLLARFFNKYKITKQEYENWYYKLNLK